MREIFQGLALGALIGAPWLTVQLLIGA